MSPSVEDLSKSFVALLESHLSVASRELDLCPCCFKTWPADMTEEKKEELRRAWREQMESMLADLKGKQS